MKKQIFFLLSYFAAILCVGAFFAGQFEVAAITAVYTMVSVVKPKPGAGTPGNKKDRIVIFDWDDVLTFNRVPGEAAVDGNLVMKAGKYQIEIYATLSSISPSYSTEGDPDAMGIIHALAFNHPGASKEIKDFLQNHLNKNLGAIVQKCGSNEMTVYGSPCHPLQLNPTGVEDENQVAQQITLTGINRTEYWPADYTGTLTLASATGTFAQDDATPSVANGHGQYQTVDNTTPTEITSLDDAVDKGVYTLLGSGGSEPSTIPSGNDFILRNGTTWTALAGSQITFKAIKTGASSFQFVEQSRS
mgnify:FL=1